MKRGGRMGEDPPSPDWSFFKFFYLKTLIHVWNINKQVDLKNTI